MNTKAIFTIVLAIIGGEIALILFATLAQEVLFNGIRYTTATNLELLFGGMATFVAAMLAGMVARLISKKYNFAVPLGISLLITAETSYLISVNFTNDPIWFDIMGGFSLILGVWLGYSLKEFLFRNKPNLI
ncbi:MAG: hypothetical protein Aureis2KO_26610 [Aureisphaera sp.]